jgi:DNA-binding MarR family transcriptional regulator
LIHSDYNILAEFRYLLRQFARFSEIAAHDVGLTTQQHQALLAIQGFSAEQSLTIGELAERLNLRSHSVVGLVNRLVRRGLVRRRPDLQDARRVRVELSAQGGKLLARLSKVHREELQRLAPLLKRLIAQLT